VKKLELSLYFVFIPVLTLITIFVFMVSKSYDNLMGPIEKTRNDSLLKPINTDLDVNTIKLIESRLDIKYIASASAAASASASPP